MKAAVPVPYIIALIFAIAVVALIGYWYFTSSGLWGGQYLSFRCSKLAHEFCSTWQNTGTKPDEWDAWLQDKGMLACTNLTGFDEMNADRCAELGYAVPS